MRASVLAIQRIAFANSETNALAVGGSFEPLPGVEVERLLTLILRASMCRVLSPTTVATHRRYVAPLLVAHVLARKRLLLLRARAGGTIDAGQGERTLIARYRHVTGA